MERFTVNEGYLAKLGELGLDDRTARLCTGMRFCAGETIFREGEPISYLGIVICGRAKACTTSYDGRDLTFCYYVSEGVVGDIELMAGLSTATATLIAVSELECLAIPYHVYWAELKDNAGFNMLLGRALAEKVLRNSDSFKYAALYSGQARLCMYILQMSYHQTFDVSLTDVSQSVGISYRHLHRLLTQLCTSGLLQRQETGYLILDPQRLRQIACGEEI